MMDLTPAMVAMLMTVKAVTQDACPVIHNIPDQFDLQAGYTQAMAHVPVAIGGTSDAWDDYYLR
jgi:hypothetical protein